jgi:hypothetical protein
MDLKLLSLRNIIAKRSLGTEKYAMIMNYQTTNTFLGVAGLFRKEHANTMSIRRVSSHSCTFKKFVSVLRGLKNNLNDATAQKTWRNS